MMNSQPLQTHLTKRMTPITAVTTVISADGMVTSNPREPRPPWLSSKDSAQAVPAMKVTTNAPTEHRSHPHHGRSDWLIGTLPQSFASDGAQGRALLLRD